MSVSFIWVRYFQAAFQWTGQHLAVGRILVSDIAFSELSVAVAIGRRIQESDLRKFFVFRLPETAKRF